MNEFFISTDDPDELAPQEVHQILFWLEKNADAGDPVAQFELSKIYEAGQMTQTRIEDSVTLEDKSARQGYVPALFSRALRQIEGRNVPQDTHSALGILRYLMEADAEHRLGHARLILDAAHAYHQGAPPNDAAAYLVACNFMHSPHITSAQRGEATDIIHALHPNAFREGATIQYYFTDANTGLLGTGGRLEELSVVPASMLPPRPREGAKPVSDGQLAQAIL